MGSDLYLVQTRGIDGRTVELDVQCIHPDVLHVLDDPGFALMLLHTAASSGTVPLTATVSLTDLMDPTWAEAHARGFVAEVRAHDVRNPVPDAARDDLGHPYWDDLEQWLGWQLTVTVTDEAWLAHLTEGSHWHSRAFSPATTYAPRDPVQPVAPIPLDSDEGMFVWVPGACLWNNVEDWTTLPALLEMPAYPETRYEAVDPLVGDDIVIDPSWIGRPVLATSRYDTTELGVVVDVSDPQAPLIVHMGPGSYGSSAMELERIGRARPVATRLPGEKLAYRTVLARTPVTVRDVRSEGTRVVMTLQVPPDGRDLPVQSETDALDLLLAPLWADRDEQLRSADSALATALLADGVARGLETHRRLVEVLPRVASAYVASFSVQPPPAAPVPDLDAMSHDEARAVLEGPWPTATVEIELTDARWAAHLVGLDRPFVVREGPLPPPMADEPEPEGLLPEPDARVVLWREARHPEVWIGERRGSEVWHHAGRRDRETRDEATEALASVHDATERLRALVQARLDDGYRRLPGADEAARAVEARTGLALAATRPPVVVTTPDPATSADDAQRFRPGDRITGVGVLGGDDFTHLHTVEELDAALERQTGPRAYVWYERPAAGFSTSVSVPLGGSPPRGTAGPRRPSGGGVPAAYRISGGLMIASGLFNLLVASLWFLSLVWVCVGVLWLVPMAVALVEIGVGVACLAGVRIPVAPLATPIAGMVNSLVLFNIGSAALETVAAGLQLAAMNELKVSDEHRA